MKRYLSQNLIFCRIISCINRYREIGKVFGKATYGLTPSSHLTLSALYYDHTTGKGRNFFYDKLTLNQYWMNYINNGKLIDLQGLVYFNQADKTAFQDTAKDNYSSLLRKEKMPSTTWGFDFQGSIPLSSWANLTTGAAYKGTSWDYDDDYVASTRYVGANGKQQYISPFANINFSLFEGDLMTNLDVRYDWIETSNGANWDSNASAGIPAYGNKYDTNSSGSFSPKIGAAWHPDKITTIRASAGKGFRAPSLLELYKVHVRGGGTYYREANPKLTPEEIWSYDLGAERLLKNNLLGKLSFYKSFAVNYIGDRLLGTGTFSGDKTRYEYKLNNISEVDIHGLETEFQWYTTSDLTFIANYAYNISKVSKDENSADIEGNYLTNDPRHNLHVGTRYQNPKAINVSLFTNYYADIFYDNENTLHTGNYWTVDVSVSRTFSNRYTFYASVENIFNKEYQIFLSPSTGDTIAPGMIATFGAKYKL